MSKIEGTLVALNLDLFQPAWDAWLFLSFDKHSVRYSVKVQMHSGCDIHKMHISVSLFTNAIERLVHLGLQQELAFPPLPHVTKNLLNA